MSPRITTATWGICRTAATPLTVWKHRAPLHQTAISRRHELHTGCEAVAHATGTIRWRSASGDVSADVKLRQDGKDLGNFSFAWNDVDVNAIASVTGTLNGNRVKAKRIAP